MEMPQEIAQAKKAYFKAYDAIKAKIKENKRKYVGTKFSDCPPLIKEQGQFLVKKAVLEATRDRLALIYGECPATWIFWAAWYETHKQNFSDDAR